MSDSTQLWICALVAAGFCGAWAAVGRWECVAFNALWGALLIVGATFEARHERDTAKGKDGTP